jgi:3-oxoacyl-[acyl-carrier-protein] synthase-3
MEKVVVNVDNYGNTSAASIPLAMDEAVKDGKLKNDDIVVLVGFGAGLTWASCVIKWYREDKTVEK